MMGMKRLTLVNYLLPRDDPEMITHVLIVDDDEPTRFTMRTVLEFGGYEVFEAENGRPALDRLRTHPQGLVVVLDKNMPGMDGQAVLEAVAAEPTLATHHAFILVSAYVEGTLPYG
jgi:CheY-like chemotaxis protein